MSTAEQKRMKAVYEGSVKRVWQCPTNEDHLLFQFTDDYSIFDWGKMPDRIENKGRALAIFGACFFQRLADPLFWKELLNKNAIERLEPDFFTRLKESNLAAELKQNGMKSHFLSLEDESGRALSLKEAAEESASIYMKVLKAKVQRPEAALILNQNVFDYPAADQAAKCRLIPLEVVFRFGMPQGSSLEERLKNNPDYAFSLGLKSCPHPGEFFGFPVLEFYTKLEPKDRLLSLQEAMLISGLNAAKFNELAEGALFAATALSSAFSESGIELWDGKFEFVINDGEILLADSIGPDELRLLYGGVHLSKEMIRQVYRGSIWEKSLKTAQERAKERRSIDWKKICIEELKSEPSPLDPDMKSLINHLYGTLSNELSGVPLFKNHPGLKEFVEVARKTMRRNSG